MVEAAILADEKIDEWNKLAEAARPGPWFWEPATNSPWGSVGPWLKQINDDKCIIESYGYDVDGITVSDEDAAFIATARTAVPALIEEVRRLRAELSR